MGQSNTQLQRANRKLTHELDDMRDLYNTANNAALKFREDSVSYKGLWRVAEQKHQDSSNAIKIIVGGIVIAMTAVILMAIYWR